MWKRVLVLALIAVQSVYAAPTVTQEKESKFIAIADIHFDPFSGCVKKQKHCVLVKKLQDAPYTHWDKVFEQYGDKRISGYYHDANYVLLKSSLQELKKVYQRDKPKFGFMLGDFLAHNFREQFIEYTGNRNREAYQTFVKKTLQFITYEIEETFPDIDVYPVVGNNDSYTGDYTVKVNGEFLQDAMNTWSSLFRDKENLADFRDTFADSGYYVVTLPDNDDHEIIVLNTVLFTDRIHNAATREAALKQLEWLHQTLLEAQQLHMKVILAFHIPIGIDVFATIKNKFDIKEFWQPIYTKKFEAELKQFSDVITAILPAHIHMETVQLIVLKQLANIPVNFTPSISPIFGNNPGFKVYTYDPDTLHIKSFVTYTYPLSATAPAWKLALGTNNVTQPDCLSCRLDRDLRKINENRSLALYFKENYAIGADTNVVLKKDNLVSDIWCATLNHMSDKVCLA